MKKITSAIIALSFAALSLTACGSESTATETTTAADTTAAAEEATEAAADDTAAADTEAETEAAESEETAAEGDNVIKVGATSTPHGEILEFVKDALAEKGYDLQITIYDDYVLPNKALADGELDANYFQHTPYLNSYNESNGTDLVSAALIHYEPFGLYGNGVASIDEVAEGASIVIPADDSNETRALLLLAQEGLITLPEGANAIDGVTTLDIVDDHGYSITTVQADTVAAQFANSDEGSLAVINGNYALAAGLDINSAIAVEDASGDAAQTYANIIAVRNGDENSEKIQALISVLQTDDVKQYIADNYNGAVVAIF
ncbi:MAG: MetQ/NlpA family ABC transporter substrate-binding protein [Oscillospiraceae bacterium]